jgi:hypothetical protein
MPRAEARDQRRISAAFRVLRLTVILGAQIFGVKQQAGTEQQSETGLRVRKIPFPVGRQFTRYLEPPRATDEGDRNRHAASQKRSLRFWGPTGDSLFTPLFSVD